MGGPNLRVMAVMRPASAFRSPRLHGTCLFAKQKTGFTTFMISIAVSPAGLRTAVASLSWKALSPTSASNAEKYLGDFTMRLEARLRSRRILASPDKPTKATLRS